MIRNLAAAVLGVFITLIASTGYAMDTEIVACEAAFLVDGPGATAKGNVLRIEHGGTYILTGAMEDGSICIDAAEEDPVTLVLSGFSLHNAHGPALHALRSGGVTLWLADGTINRLSDGDAYTDVAGDANAAVFAQADLTICGNGQLSISGRHAGGLVTRSNLTLSGGILQVDAAKNGIIGHSSVTVEGGEISIVAQQDGLKANREGDAQQGWIRIDAGSISIQAGEDGIQAETDLTIAGGDLSILAGGGSALATLKSEFDDGVLWGASASADNLDGQASGSMKGLKAGTSLAILGGTIAVDAADDALHSNGAVRIDDGTIILRSGDDGIHADAAVEINGGTVEILYSYEGIEGVVVRIAGGDIAIIAHDDGINAAGSSSDSAVEPDADAPIEAADPYLIDIQGGAITIHAEGDGLDSNWNIRLSGGSLAIYGPVGGIDSALDADGLLTIGAGANISAGGARMPDLPAESSAQLSLAVYYAERVPAGTLVALCDAAGNAICSFAAEKDVERLLFSHPALLYGGNYTLTTGDAQAAVTLTDIVTRVDGHGNPTENPDIDGS